MGSFVSFLTLWQGQAAKDMLALSLPEIKNIYPANQFLVAEGLFLTLNVA